MAADPNWTAQFIFSQAPEANGLTRTLYGTPTVTSITTGSAANRRLIIDSAGGDCVFTTSQVPSLDSTVGATIEFTIAQTGAGDAGFELTFLNRAFGVEIHETSVTVRICQDAAPGEITQSASTALNTTDVLWRLTVDGSSQLRLYRAGTLIIGPVTVPGCVKPFQRVLFWGEGGGTSVWKKVAYYIGGAVAP